MKPVATVVARAVAILLFAAGCDDRVPTIDLAVAGASSAGGRAAIARHGCGACHTIPGIVGADARLAPPLTSMRRQAYVAGVVPNVPEQLVRWIMDPVAVDPRTTMPDTDVTEREARDIAAYLYGAGR